MTRKPGGGAYKLREKNKARAVKQIAVMDSLLLPSPVSAETLELWEQVKARIKKEWLL